MRFRSPLVAAIAFLAIGAAAAPALAHEEISPQTITVGQAAYLSLTVANEKEVNLVKVKLEAPQSVEFGTALEGKDEWATTRSSFRMTWDGTVGPGSFETFRYEIEGADQPGTLAYKVILSYADGTTEEHEVDITAVAGSGGPTATTTATATSAPPTTAAAAPADSGGGSDSGSGTAKAALGISIVALLVAAGALAAGARRGGAGPDPSRTSGSGAAPGAAQDW